MTNKQQIVFITGASGLIGQQISHVLQNDHQVFGLNRIADSQQSDAPRWSFPQNNGKNINPNIIIHLAGENIAARRWSKAQKKRLYDSRIVGTKHLVEKIISSECKPHTFLCAFSHWIV